MPHKSPCHSCDDKGEHWHWEGEPFLSRNFRGPCDSCGGKKFSLIFHAHELRPLVDGLPLARLLRLDAELYVDTFPLIKSQTLYWLKAALKGAVRDRLRFEFRMTETALHRWWLRLQRGITPGLPKRRPVLP